MQKRTLDNLLRELAPENHVQMVKFVEELKKHEWAQVLVSTQDLAQTLDRLHGWQAR